MFLKRIRKAAGIVIATALSVAGMSMLATPEANASDIFSDQPLKIEVSINQNAEINYAVGAFPNRERCFSTGLSSVNRVIEQVSAKSAKEAKITCKKHGNMVFGQVSIKDTMISSGQSDQVVMYRGENSIRFLVNPDKRADTIASINTTVLATESVPTKQWSASRSIFTNLSSVPTIRINNDSIGGGANITQTRFSF